MIQLVTLNPALDLSLELSEKPDSKIGKLLDYGLEAGGKALNVARFLKKWGMEASLWLGTGGGSHPTHLLYRSLLEKEGLTARFLSGEAPIRVNAVTRAGTKAMKYNHPGYPLSPGIFFKLLPAVSRKDTVVLTGRLPEGMKASTYAGWIKVFKGRKVRTVLDTSGAALAQGLRANPWFFKVNLFEFSEACDKEFRGLDQVAKLLPVFQKHGLSHGGVTNGSEGALLWDEGEAVLVSSSRRSKAKLVVGAGDAFLAGYLRGIETGKGLVDRAKLACAAGTVVARYGIQGFKPNLVQGELKNLNVKRIKLS